MSKGRTGLWTVSVLGIGYALGKVTLAETGWIVIALPCFIACIVLSVFEASS